MRKKWFLLLAGPAALLSGCGGSSPRSTPTTAPSTTVQLSLPTASTSTPSTTAPSTSTTPATSKPPPTTGPSGPAACASADLAAALGQSSGAAGKIVYQLLLRNTSGLPCTLAGYPGVSFVTGPSGQQVGAPAERVPASYSSVLVQPGQQAEATLAVEDPANYPSSCQVTDVAGLRVFPPGQTAPLYVAHGDRTCANPADVTLQISPLAAISG